MMLFEDLNGSFEEEDCFFEVFLSHVDTANVVGTGGKTAEVVGGLEDGIDLSVVEKGFCCVTFVETLSGYF